VDQVIRENPASRGTEASAEVLVGPPWRMVSNAGQQQWYRKGLSDRNRLAGGSQLISKFLREIEPTVSQFLNVHAFRK
jgi:hypothetical protein